ncbi:MAG: type II secretion system protein GspM [Desulfocapsaceae bacterium]|nr:type II secretion system protein GspM [Desulfocapsaceae bacterium]
MTPLLLRQKLRSIWGKTGIQRLEQREKIFLGVGVVFLLCFFLMQVVFFPYLDAKKRLAKSLKDKRSYAVKIVQMQKEYRLLKGQAETTKGKLSEREPGFTLFSFLEEQATTAKVKEQIQYMKPSTTDQDGAEQKSLVEMKLQRISLDRLVGFLKLIESSKAMVIVKHISIQESSTDDNALDVVLQVFTFVDKT